MKDKELEEYLNMILTEEDYQTIFEYIYSDDYDPEGVMGWLMEMRENSPTQET